MTTSIQPAESRSPVDITYDQFTVLWHQISEAGAMSTAVNDQMIAIHEQIATLADDLKRAQANADTYEAMMQDYKTQVRLAANKLHGAAEHGRKIEREAMLRNIMTEYDVSADVAGAAISVLLGEADEATGNGYHLREMRRLIEQMAEDYEDWYRQQEEDEDF